MKEYQFQYTNQKASLAIVLSVAILLYLTIFVGVYLKLNLILIFFVVFCLIVLVSKLLKRKAVHFCKAKISDNSIIFYFETKTKVINFNELTSYKSYNGTNGTVLYLNSNKEKFKIFANINFCKAENFKIFADDAIIELDKYKSKNNLSIIHEGSIFATKGFFYFLLFATLIYGLSFFFESKNVMPYIGFGGGIYLLIIWIAYFNKRDLKNK